MFIISCPKEFQLEYHLRHRRHREILDMIKQSSKYLPQDPWSVSGLLGRWGRRCAPRRCSDARWRSAPTAACRLPLTRRRPRVDGAPIGATLSARRFAALAGPLTHIPAILIWWGLFHALGCRFGAAACRRRRQRRGRRASYGRRRRRARGARRRARADCARGRRRRAQHGQRAVLGGAKLTKAASSLAIFGSRLLYTLWRSHRAFPLALGGGGAVPRRPQKSRILLPLAIQVRAAARGRRRGRVRHGARRAPGRARPPDALFLRFFSQPSAQRLVDGSHRRHVPASPRERAP